jgi:hypothetical protein
MCFGFTGMGNDVMLGNEVCYLHLPVPTVSWFTVGMTAGGLVFTETV